MLDLEPLGAGKLSLHSKTQQTYKTQPMKQEPMMSIPDLELREVWAQNPTWQSRPSSSDVKFNQRILHPHH